jgi:glycosyltransferase AglD
VRVRLILVSVGLTTLLALALALAPLDLHRALNYVAEHPFEVALALLVYTAAFALRTASWRPLIGVRVPFAKLFSLLMGGLFLNHAAPAKAGDLARMYALARRVPTQRAVASVVLSRSVDLAGLISVLVVSWALAGAGGWDRVWPPLLAVVAAGVALFLLVRFELLALIGARFGVVGRYVDRAQAALRETTRAALLVSFAFAAPAWVLEAGILLVVGRGLGLELSLAEVVAATCFAVLVAVVPLAPGSLGTYEAGIVAVLLAFGVPVESAFAAAVTTHAVKFLYALAAAPFALGEGLAAVRKGKVRSDEAGLEV